MPTLIIFTMHYYPLTKQHAAKLIDNDKAAVEIHNINNIKCIANVPYLPGSIQSTLY